ncbi:hypothetical protein ACUHMQ_16940 [Chitinimonas sp. PSY-7]|uniref:hypothetical protein n=1 Tax=Chitinimonas sp. PSY-7 TaxID=3459088 RepID=UPI00403FE722
MPTSKLEAMWHLVLTQRSQLLQTLEDSTASPSQTNATKSAGKMQTAGNKAPILGRSRQVFA